MILLIAGVERQALINRRDNGFDWSKRALFPCEGRAGRWVLIGPLLVAGVEPLARDSLSITNQFYCSFCEPFLCFPLERAKMEKLIFFQPAQSVPVYLNRSKVKVKEPEVVK